METNIDPPSGSRASWLNNKQCATDSPVSCISVERFCNNSIPREINEHAEDETPETPISATLPQYECSGRNECSMISSLLDEDFDQSILEEIDSLCEGSSNKKLEKKIDTNEDSTHNSETNGYASYADGTPKTKSNWENCSGNNIPDHGKLPSSQDVQGNVSLFQNRDADEKQPEEFLSIPETYSKYMGSLNQDQLEAASTDASTPLMVVAGPRSGKVGPYIIILDLWTWTTKKSCS